MSSGGDFLYTDDELEELFPRIEEGEDDFDLTPRDQNDCEALLRKLDSLRDECGEIEAHYQSQLQSLNDWRDQRLTKKVRGIRYAKDILFTYLRLTEKKITKGRASTVITDFDKLLKFATDKGLADKLINQPPAPPPKPDKKGIAAYAKEHGSYPAGTEVSIGLDSFSISTSTPSHPSEVPSPNEASAEATAKP
jgi:hypothetical protein